MTESSFLNIDNLYAHHIQKDKNKLRFYDEIYQKILRKITLTNKDYQRLCCTYEVPVFVFGGPIYDYEELKRYLLFKLTKNGLLAEYLDNKTIYVSWRPEDINRQKYETELDNIHKRLEKNYNIVHSKVYENRSKRSKNQPPAEIGLMQYNDDLMDLIPINPKKIQRIRPVDNFAAVSSNDNTQTMWRSAKINDGKQPPSTTLHNTLHASCPNFL